MEAANIKHKRDRRQFLSILLPAGMIACMSCPKMLSAAQDEQLNGTLNQDDSYQERSEMSYESIFNFAFRDHLIPILKELSTRYRKEEFLNMMKESASQAFTQKEVMDKSNKNLNQVFWKHVIEREVIEDSDKAFELKITKCLWEKVYREAEAADLGYAIVCHADFATAEASNQTLVRTKTLMRGDDCCNHRWNYNT
jgi:hypothetical protein